MIVFRESWYVDASPDRVRDVLVDLEHYPQWWPQVVAVARLGPDEARVLCRSALPYTLDLVLRAVSRELPTVEVELDGALVGFARWTLAETGSGTAMVFEQRVEVGGALGLLARVAAPLARWNHRHMMRGGRRGLERRLGVR